MKRIPTPSLSPRRLAFLSDVDAGRVLVDPYSQAHYADDQGRPWGRRCTALWREAEAAGWVFRPHYGDRWRTGKSTGRGRIVMEKFANISRSEACQSTVAGSPAEGATNAPADLTAQPPGRRARPA